MSSILYFVTNDFINKVDNPPKGFITQFFFCAILQIAVAAKNSAQNTANYYLGRAQSSTIAQQTTKQLDNAVSFSELMVEICFPTDGRSAEDVMELEKAEEDEDKGLVVRAGNLKDRALRRGTRKLMSYRPIASTVDTVSFCH